jgi:hypothetical protein
MGKQPLPLPFLPNVRSVLYVAGGRVFAALLVLAAAFAACKSNPPPESAAGADTEAPLSDFILPEPPARPYTYTPLTRDYINQIKGSKSIIINSRFIIQLEGLQYYISQGITLNRHNTKPLVEVDALGRLTQWTITSEEQLDIRGRTGGILVAAGLEETTDTLTLRICFDDDERKILDFRQDPGRENRFYLTTAEQDGKFFVTYGERRYEVFPSPDAVEISSDTAGPAPVDGDPYLEIVIAEPKKTGETKRRRQIEGRLIEH